MRAQFGGGIDPRLGLIDYSGIARAAEIRARNNRMREEDEERKRQEKMKAVGSIIQTFKQKSDENKKLDLFAENAYRKLGSEDKADQRFLNVYGISEGMFGDMDEKEKKEAIKNTFKSLGIETVTDLENARKLSELKLAQDIERSQAEYESLISFGSGSDGTKETPNFNTNDLTNIENSEAYDKLPQADKDALTALKTGTNSDGSPITNANAIYEKVKSEFEKAEKKLKKDKKIKRESELISESLNTLYKGTGSFTGKDRPASYY